MASPTASVEVSGLVKTYGDVRAVDGLDLHIQAGTVVAILGPNGAGKTTIVEINVIGFTDYLERPDLGRPTRDL